MTRQGYSGWKDQNKNSGRQELKLRLRAFCEASFAVAIIFGGMLYIAYLVVEKALPVYVGF